MMACKGDSGVKDEARDSLNVPETTTTTIPTPSISTTTGGSAVPHYKCPNDCEGSGGAGAGTCPVCGTAYVHNQAFHSQTTPAVDVNQTGDVQITPTTNPTASPAQNASGVFHYICPSGCEGGSSSGGECGKCGTALTHNTAFHN